MAHSQETRDKLRNLYIRERLPLRAAADKAGVSYDTARTWKKRALEDGDDWDIARNAHRMMISGMDGITALVLEDFALLFSATMEGLKTAEIAAVEQAEAMSRLADAYTKTVKSAQNASPRISKLAVALEVVELLAAFVDKRFPQHMDAFVAILEPFGKALNRKYR